MKQFHKSYPLYAQVEDEAMNELFLRTGVFLDCWPDIVVSFLFFFFLFELFTYFEYIVELFLFMLLARKCFYILSFFLF